MISLRTHNILDYVVGGVLIVAPFLFGFADIDVARNVFMLSGFFLILYSLFTNYHYAALRVIPLGVHMTLDVLLGALVIVAPWVFDYRAFLTPAQEYLHYIMGVGAFALVVLSREKSEADKRVHGIRVTTGRPAPTGRL
ncbi:MAG: hypothetical protein AB7G93_16295 [Bdellovibrionales bacterium]